GRCFCGCWRVAEEEGGETSTRLHHVSRIIMKLRSLIVAAVLLVFCGGVLSWADRHKAIEDAAKPSADASPAILKLDASAVTRLDLEKKGEKPIVLTKAESGKWQISAPQPFGADQSTISGILSTLSSLNSQRVVEDKGTDL